MILFSIPILSPINTNDYDFIIKNLEVTLQSILDQTNENWFVSIGCNDINLKNRLQNFPQDKIQITQITQQFHDLKQPNHQQLSPRYSTIFEHSVSENLFPKRNLDDGMHDKAFKRLISYFDLEIDYKYVFLLDGDDIIANNLVDVLLQQTEDIIKIRSGYMINFERRQYKFCNDLNKCCGSTIAYSKNFMETIPLNKLLLYLGGHLTQEQEHPVTFLEEEMLIYRLHEHNFAGNLWVRNFAESDCCNWNEELERFSCVRNLFKTISGLTVSIGFGDLLSTTLPINRHFFDEYIIVTSLSDELTQSVAKDNNCKLIITERHKEGNADFNKGCVINEGIDACKTQWICHLDADIVLLESPSLDNMDENAIYGINRLMCESYEDWRYYLSTGRMDRFHLKDESEGLRLAKMSSGRKYAIGYYQLWNTKHKYRYSEDNPTTLFSDLYFNHNFERVINLNKRCIHLSSGKWMRDIDSKGRKSAKWGPMYFISKMKSPQDKKQTYRGGVIQIWITRACDKSCFGCTQGSNLRGPYEKMFLEQFEVAVKSLKDYWGVVGIFGGNPCIHPQFPQICEILEDNIPFEQRGLWSNNLNGHGVLCSKIFNANVSNINTHGDIKAYKEITNCWSNLKHPNLKPLYACSEHSPPFVAIQDVIEDEIKRWELINRCDINKFWSGMIGVFRGKLRGWFCEIAGAQSILCQHKKDYPDTGCEIVPGWWNRPIEEFADQVRFHCHACGIPLRIKGEIDNTNHPEIISNFYSDVYNPKDRSVKIIAKLEDIELNDERPVTDYIKDNHRKVFNLKMA